MARLADWVLPGGIWHPSNNPDGTQIGLSIDRYAELMGWGIVGFNGLNRPDDREDVECDGIWLQSSRDRLGMSLLRAEQMREDELQYHVGIKYVVDELATYRNPISLNKKHLKEIGVPTVADISTGVALNLGAETDPNDPVTLTVASTVSASEVRIYYPDEDYEITPTSITTDGATLTIKIPRSRLVKPSLNDDREDTLSYYENDNFLETVDVKRFYMEPDGGCQYFWRNPCDACVTDCTIKYQDACSRIKTKRGYRLSTIHCEPACYSSGAWSTASWTYSDEPDGIQVSYSSGVEDLLTFTRTARLAHTLMPYCPCDCKAVSVIWEEDRDRVPQTWTPYGNRQGAVNAWMSDSRRRVGQGGKIARVG